MPIGTLQTCILRLLIYDAWKRRLAVSVYRGWPIMAFRLPTFNLAVSIWHEGSNTDDPPDVECMGNLAYGKRVNTITDGGTGFYHQSQGVYLLVPAGTDVRDNIRSAAQDVVEVPASSGRFYRVLYVEDAGKGFPNEHRVATLFPDGGWPTPYP